MEEHNQYVTTRNIVKTKLGEKLERLIDDALCAKLADELLAEATPKVHRIILHLPRESSQLKESYTNIPSRQEKISIMEARSQNYQQEVLRLIQGERVVSTMPLTNTIVAELTRDELKHLAEAQSIIQGIEIDKTILPELNLSTASIQADTQIRQTFGITGKGVVVAIIGGKVDADHRAFLGEPTEQGSHFEGKGRVRFPRDYGYLGEATTHETLIAGIIAGRGVTNPDGVEFIGIAPEADIWNYPVELSIYTPGYLKAQAILDACADGADIINCSWRVAEITPRNGSCLWCKAVETAIQLGAIVVKSAGNGGPSDGTTTCPAHASGVISVGALSNDGTRLAKDNIGRDFSSRGPSGNGIPKPEVVAPGEDINGPAPGGYFTSDTYSDGTSFAAPHVSGVAALLLEKYPMLKRQPLLIREAIMEGANDLGLPENTQGKGCVNLPNAINYIEVNLIEDKITARQKSPWIELYSCLPSLAIYMESSEYFAVELASDSYIFNKPLDDQSVRAFVDPGVVNPNFFATWFTAPPLLRKSDTPTIWTIPAAVWEAFKNYEKIYYRVLSSTAEDTWQNIAYSTENSDFANAPWIDPRTCYEQELPRVSSVEYRDTTGIHEAAGLGRFEKDIETSKLKKVHKNWSVRVGDWRMRLGRKRPTVKLVDGVFEGGGTLGLAYTGSLTALADSNIWFRRAVGTSAGSIQAAAIAIGFNHLEIEYLTLSGALEIPRPDSIPEGMEPIDFRTFLDLPSEADIHAIREESIFWNLFRDIVLDRVFTQELPVPTRTELIEDITNALSANRWVPSGQIPFYPGRKTFEQLYADLVTPILNFLPGSPATISDLLPLNNQRRNDLVEEIWSILAGLDSFRAIVAILHKGGIFKGDSFLEKMRELAELKLGDPDATFNHSNLKAELAVIASNISDTSMCVYSRETTPDLPIAEAVRRSMSVPFFFYPRIANGQEIVDGGLFDNYPYLLFSDAAVAAGWMPPPVRRGHIPSGETEVPLLGFRLDDSTAAPEDWDTYSAKWTNEDGQPYKPSLSEGLVGGNVGMANIFDEIGISSNDFLNRFLKVYRAYSNTDPTRDQILKNSVLDGRKFEESNIPLMGYFWLDFDCNCEQSTVLSMCDRGWQTAMDMLKSAGLVSSFSRNNSPYR